MEIRRQNLFIWSTASLRFRPENNLIMDIGGGSTSLSFVIKMKSFGSIAFN